jgi:hypothetical protein
MKRVSWSMKEVIGDAERYTMRKLIICTRQNKLRNVEWTDGVSGQRHAPDAFYPRERTAGNHLIGGLVGLRASLDTDAGGKVLCLCRLSNPCNLDLKSVVKTLY